MEIMFPTIAFINANVVWDALCAIANKVKEIAIAVLRKYFPLKENIQFPKDATLMENLTLPSNTVSNNSSENNDGGSLNSSHPQEPLSSNPNNDLEQIYETPSFVRLVIEGAF